MSDFCTEALSAMTRARSALVLDHPFFGSLALRLKFKEDPSCRDLWTDGKTLGYNPLYASTLPAEKLVAAQAHEILHLACGHHVRRKDRDETLWNRACDYAVNHILLEAGFSLPEGFLHKPEYGEMPVDEIYALLTRLQDEETHGGASEAVETAPGGGGEASGSMRMDDGQENDGDTSINGSAEKQAESGEGGMQSGSGKLVEHVEKSKGQNEAEGKISFTGEVRDHPALNGLDNDRAAKMAEREADVALTQAVQRARNMGSLPAGFTRLVRERLRPSLDWRELLQRFLENCANSDYSWNSPNRRYIFQDIYLPSRREPQIPHIALAIDSSGSVDETALAIFCGELSAVLDAYDTTLTVLFHDTRVQSSHVFGRSDLPLELVPQGGGGTDYRPVCDYLEEQDITPTCLIWFTDLQCNRFPVEPPFPVLWVSSLDTSDKPPFGEVIRLGQAV